MAKSKDKTAFDTSKHILVPKHEKLSDKEKKALLEQYNTKLSGLPKIRITDPAISHLDVKLKDVIKVTRNSMTAGESFYYRRVAK